MELTDFIKKYNGKTVGYPEGKYVGECLSIVKWYIKECFGVNPPPSGTNSAYGYWSKFPDPLGTIFKKVVNTKGAVIKTGDIPIWKTAVGNGSGHIEVCLRGGNDDFSSFGQNWGGRHSHVTDHDFKNVAGWLTPKVTNSNINKDETNALLILKKFKSENEKLKDGNLEGAISAMVGWSKSEEKLGEVKENLKISLKTNTTLLSKISALEKSNTLWQNKVKTAKGKTTKANDLASANMKLYKNKNDEFNAVKYMTTKWIHLVNFCVLKFKGAENEEYLKEEIPKVVKSLNKEA